MTKGLLYYSCNRHPERIVRPCQDQLLRCLDGTRYVLGVVSLKPIVGFGDWNIVLDRPPCRETMHYQIMAGLERMHADLVFMVETDVLYHPSHFDFVPPTLDRFWYNQHVWRVDSETGRAVFYWAASLSGACASRELWLDHWRKRIAGIEANGGHYNRSIGFEPGHPPGRVDDTPSGKWMSWFPNIDIRHPATQTKSRWDPSGFRDKTSCLGWMNADGVPSWGKTEGRFWEFLEGLKEQAA